MTYNPTKTFHSYVYTFSYKYNLAFQQISVIISFLILKKSVFIVKKVNYFSVTAMLIYKYVTWSLIYSWHPSSNSVLKSQSTEG